MTVTPDQIAVVLGRAAPSNGSATYLQWEQWIEDASMLIEARLGDLTALDQPKLDYVIREAVVAQVRRPDDATQVQVSIDDASTSRTYSSSRGRVTILDEWWELLSPATTSRAFSFSPTCSSGEHLPWCSLSMGAAYCSCGVDIAGYPIFEGGSL